MTIFGKIILGLILLTGGIFLIKGSMEKKDDVVLEEVENTENQESVESSENTQEENSIFSGTMKELISRGGNYKCEFTFNSDVADSSGVVYLSGNKLRGDFTSDEKVSGTQVKSYMVNDGEFSYVWSSIMPVGVKIKNNLTEDSSSQATQSFDYNQKLDYKCESWNVDNSKFDLPADVKFNELTV